MGPQINIVGSFFPSWMLCALIGIATAFFGRWLFVRAGLDMLFRIVYYLRAFRRVKLNAAYEILADETKEADVIPVVQCDQHVGGKPDQVGTHLDAFAPLLYQIVRFQHPEYGLAEAMPGEVGFLVMFRVLLKLGRAQLLLVRVEHRDVTRGSDVRENETGGRKAKSPIILTVRARDAWAAGVAFYAGNDKVWLADHVPPAFLAGRP